MALFSRGLRKWVAGENMEDAIERVKKLNFDGAKGMVNFLGENYKNKDKVEETVEEYLKLFGRIFEEKLNAGISLKVSQIGAEIDEQYCLENLNKLAEAAHKYFIFVWLDMENSPFTQLTLDLYSHVFKKFQNVGIC